MKVFTYSYYIPYGNGVGIVVAESKEEAIVKVKEAPYNLFDDDELILEELDITKEQLIDMSWEE